LGIRANCISPGLISNETFADLLRDPNDNMQKQVRTSPLGRVGRPEDVAPLAVFLPSDEPGYVTGATLVVEGGQTPGSGMSFGETPSVAMSQVADLPTAEGEHLRIDTPDGQSGAWLFSPRGRAGPHP